MAQKGGGPTLAEAVYNGGVAPIADLWVAMIEPAALLPFLVRLVKTERK
jgi:hypothetical protein